MFNNPEEVQKFVDSYEELEFLALPIGEELAKLQNHFGQLDLSDGKLNIECGQLYYTYETYCCGDYENHSVVVPLEYLFDDKWIEEAKAENLRKNLEAVAKKKEEDAKKERLAKARRYEEYLDLCKEFDEDS